MGDGFFNKSFFQLLLVQTLGSLVSITIAGVISLYIGGQIERLTTLSESVNKNMETLMKLIELGPEGIAEVGAAIQENAEKSGVSIGDGGAIVVDKIGNAVKNFTIDHDKVVVDDTLSE